MGERMTSAELREFAIQCGMNSALGPYIAALAAYEAEDAARRGMPGLAEQWVVLDKRGAAFWADGRTYAVEKAKCYDGEYPDDAPHRAVRLAVVEVAEPVTPVPVRWKGPSGYEYVLSTDGDLTLLTQWHGVGLTRVITPAVYRYDRDGWIPPADRALVARLLGEVG